MIKFRHPRSKVPILSKGNHLYVPYAAAVFSRERLTQIAEKAIKKVMEEQRGNSKTI